jgi:hypothetical protein
MQKRFEIKRRMLTWVVLHNDAPVCRHLAKRDAIRAAFTLGRLQRRLGDDSEIILCDEAGAPSARRLIRALLPVGAAQV